MDPKIHHHSKGGCISCTDSPRNGVRGKEHQKGASPKMHSIHHCGETQPLLARPHHGLVLLDPAGEHVVLQDTARAGGRPGPHDA